MRDAPTTAETLEAMIIADVLERWPATADVFNAHALACVGCALAPFCTVLDAAMAYGMAPEEWTGELLRAIDGLPGGD